MSKHVTPGQSCGWTQADQELVDLKLRIAESEFEQQHADRLRNEPPGNQFDQFTRQANLHFEWANTWAGIVRATYLEVWGKPLTPSLLRSVVKDAVIAAINRRIQDAARQMESTARFVQLSTSPFANITITNLTLKGDRLKGDWVARTEIEARELELARPTVGGHSTQEIAEGAMAELPPDLTKLPAGLLSAGDPVEGNPFQIDDVRHNVWADATRKAEEETCRLNVELLSTAPAQTLDKMALPALGPAAFAAWSIHGALRKFDIWAKRNIHVVWSDGAARDYDQWLFNYAEGWLEGTSKTCPGLVDKESLLVELRARLIQRREYWRAEARRYLAQQKAHNYPTDNESRDGAAAQAAFLHASVSPPRFARPDDPPPARPLEGGETEELRTMLKECKSKLDRFRETYPSLDKIRRTINPPDFERDYYALLRQCQEIERELLNRNAAPLAERQSTSDSAPEPVQDFSYSQDFRSVTFNGKVHSLTSRQAQIVQMLHEAFQAGTPELGQAYILESLGTSSSRLRDSFKDSALWRTLIIPGKRRGTVRLNLRDPETCRA